MAKVKKSNDQEEVNTYIEKLAPALREIVRGLRKTILEADPRIAERIKWNHPSFYYTGEMAPFNPKEYKSDIAVFNFHKGRIMLVFPTGKKAYDATGMLTGEFVDGRKILIVKDEADAKSKYSALQVLIKEWIKVVNE
jgi:hypothetical protein